MPEIQCLPAYKQKIRERQERKIWPSYDEVLQHPNTSPFLIENNCDADCPYVYECVVVRMKCPPGSRRLWLAWQQGANNPDPLSFPVENKKEEHK